MHIYGLFIQPKYQSQTSLQPETGNLHDYQGRVAV